LIVLRRYNCSKDLEVRVILVELKYIVEEGHQEVEGSLADNKLQDEPQQASRRGRQETKDMVRRRGRVRLVRRTTRLNNVEVVDKGKDNGSEGARRGGD
jgi:hypothetical protein